VGITYNDLGNLVYYFTIEELAEKLNCSKSFIYKYLSNNNIHVLKKKIDVTKDKITYFESKFSKL
jgi:predicted transcriptional regulator